MSSTRVVLRRSLLWLLVLWASGCLGKADVEVMAPGIEAGRDAGSEAGTDAGDAPGSDAGVDAGDGSQDAGDEGGVADAGDPVGDGGEEDAGEEGPVLLPELEGVLEAHNLARAGEGVGLPLLQWDPQLAAIAQAWAEACVSESGVLLDHNPNRADGYDGTVGENIAAGSGSMTGRRAVELWMSEKGAYDHESGTCSAVCGHYTQVVWRNTTKVGCGYADCPDLQYGKSVVCNYAPAGNNGQRPY